ncbi:glycosyltransferase family 2 protein [bacterium]|nr:glycosyltransferase family 2 protein [bacterium]
MPEISVIVPVYKVEKYLSRCVDSILSQTFTDFELILVDDGSPDKCGEICEEYAKKDPRIRVNHQENRGQSAARNRGIELAQGAWITFVDSDDSVSEIYLRTLWEEAQSSNSSMIMCNCAEISKTDRKIIQDTPSGFERFTVSEELLIKLYNNSCFYWVVWGKLIKKSILTHDPLPEGRIYEDNATVCKWLVEAKYISIANSKLYFYFSNPEGTTRQKFSLKKLDLSWAFKEQEKFYGAIGFNEMQLLVGKDYIIHTINLLKKAYASSDSNDERVLSLTNEVESYIKEYRNQVTFSPREQKIVSLFLFFKSIKLLKQAMRLYYNAEKLMFWRKK